MNPAEYHFIFERTSLSRTPVIQRFEYDGGGKLIYYGIARKGTDTADHAWSIEKYVYVGDLLDYTLMSDLTAAWDNRALETYS